VTRVNFLAALLGCVLVLLWLVTAPGNYSRPPSPNRERVVQSQFTETSTPERIFPIAPRTETPFPVDEKKAAPRVQKVNGDEEKVIQPEAAPTNPPPQRQRSLIDPGIRNRLPFQLHRGQIPGQNPPGQGAVRPPFKQRQPSQQAAERIKWPRNIPPWFKDYDTNGDGQVSLIEWKSMGDDLAEFRKYDLNGDGIITLEELIHSGQFHTGYNAPVVLVGTNPEIGQFYYWEVTGTTMGSVWGTDIYTIDSPMGAAAVHAGVLREGQTAFLKVNLLPGQQHYYGSESNGITSEDRHTGYHKSFTLETIR
jgi:hypothetical protein